MILDIEKARKEFLRYTENYDLKNENIERKQLHSLRVMEISKKIAQNLNLSQEKIEIATLIGLLHDIARFEQYTQYGTYKDFASFDHGDFGVEILKKDLRKYIKTNEYDEIIIKAIRNHNKFKIQEDMTEDELIQAQIIRDADKIDIFYESVEIFNCTKEKQNEIEESIISKYMIEQFEICTQKERKKEETPIDKVIRVISFIFDINFETSFKIIKQEDYINRILDKYDYKNEIVKQQVEKIRDIANMYISGK